MASTRTTAGVAFALFILIGCGQTASPPVKPAAAGAPDSPNEPSPETRHSGHVRTIGLLRSETQGLTSDMATGALVTWDGKPVFFLFSDSTSCTTLRSDTPTLLRFDGNLEYDQKKFPFVGEFQNAEQGSLTINGEKYDLAKGRLILVSGSAGNLRVRQLSRDLSSLNPEERTTWSSFLKGDPEIAAFFSKV